MKSIISVLAITLLVVLAAPKLIKLLNARNLKFDIGAIQFPTLKLQNLIDDIETKVEVIIKNFSNSVFDIDQISIDVFSEKGTLIAEQKEPLYQGIRIRPKGNSIIPLTYLISSQNMRKLVKDSGGAIEVGTRRLTHGEYGIKINLKGFVIAEGIKVDINETVMV